LTNSERISPFSWGDILRFLHAIFWGVDKNGIVVDQFEPFIYDEYDKPCSVFYTYVDSDVSISGYIEDEFEKIEYDQSQNEVRYLMKKITTFSIEWKKGWNVWSISNDESKSRTDFLITESWSSIHEIDLRW